MRHPPCTRVAATHLEPVGIRRIHGSVQGGPAPSVLGVKKGLCATTPPGSFDQDLQRRPRGRGGEGHHRAVGADLNSSPPRPPSWQWRTGMGKGRLWNDRRRSTARRLSDLLCKQYAQANPQPAWRLLNPASTQPGSSPAAACCDHGLPQGITLRHSTWDR